MVVPGETPDLAVVGIHGLPQIGVEPGEKLAAISRSLQRFPGLRNRFLVRPWAQPNFREVGHLLQLLKKGDFGATLSPRILDLMPSPHPDRLAVIAYSSGGALFFRWLMSQADVMSAPCAIVIAAPFQCAEGVISFEGDPHQRDYLVNDPPIDPREIAARFPAGRLMVLLAENDQTVRRHNAAFPRFSSTMDLLSNGKSLGQVTRQSATMRSPTTSLLSTSGIMGFLNGTGNLTGAICPVCASRSACGSEPDSRSIPPVLVDDVQQRLPVCIAAEVLDEDLDAAPLFLARVAGGVGRDHQVWRVPEWAFG